MAELRDIRGIGPATAMALADHGLTSVKKLAKAGLDAIVAVPGFGPVRAAAVRAEARAVVPAKGPAKGSKAKGDKAKSAKTPKTAQSEKSQKAPKPPKNKKKSAKGKKKSKKP